MIYKVSAVENSTGFPFEQDCDTEREAKALIRILRLEGYSSFQIEEIFSSLEEMYESF